MISTTANRLLQLGNQRSQPGDGLLQSSYSILAGLEVDLLETRQGLKIHYPILQKMNLFRTTVDAVMRCLPLPSEDDIVLFDDVLDHVGRRQYLLTMLLGIGLNTMNLCHMGSPLHLSIVHL